MQTNTQTLTKSQTAPKATMPVFDSTITGDAPEPLFVTFDPSRPASESQNGPHDTPQNGPRTASQNGSKPALEMTDAEWEGAAPTAPDAAPAGQPDDPYSTQADDAYSMGTFGLDYDLRDRIPYDFVPDTARKVDAVLGAIADAEARAARIREQATEMIRQAEDQTEYLRKYYMGAIEEWTRGALLGSKKSHIWLYRGVVGFSRVPATVTVHDEEAAIYWALDNLPEAVEVTLDREMVVAHLKKAKGELPAFACREPSRRMFFTK